MGDDFEFENYFKTADFTAFCESVFNAIKQSKRATYRELNHKLRGNPLKDRLEDALNCLAGDGRIRRGGSLLITVFESLDLPTVVEKTKLCRDCQTHKPLEDFYFHARSKDNRYIYCRKCESLRSARNKKNRLQRLTELAK